MIYPEGSLVDLLELRHHLVSEFNYTLTDLDDMPIYDLEMTSLIAIKSHDNKNKALG